MQIKAFGIVAAVLVVGGGIAHAQVDFGKMLGSLNFSGNDDQAGQEAIEPPPPADDDRPSTSPPRTSGAPQSLDQLKPAAPLAIDADGGLRAPSVAPPAIDRGAGDTIEQLRALPDPILLPQPSVPAGEPQQSSQFTIPSLDDFQPLDMDTLAAEQQPAHQPIRQPAVPAHDGACQSDCDAPTYCQPRHHRVAMVPPCLNGPDIPPPATFESMYRTPACYRGLWSGYATERAVACSHHHKHLHGTCECATKGACQCAQCVSTCNQCGSH
jgi:hypothetical protein